jgi:hypothetical protein
MLPANAPLDALRAAGSYDARTVSGVGIGMMLAADNV